MPLCVPFAGNDEGAVDVAWVKHSLTYWHNLLWKGAAKDRFDTNVNSSSAWETLAYTSLVPAGW